MRIPRSQFINVTAVALALALTGAASIAGDAPPHSSQPATAPATQPATEPQTEKLVLAGEEFRLVVAATPESREKGLMGEDEIKEHGGMIFIYAWPQMLGFWMKNCPIEMDIAFVNDKGIITATHRMKPAPPVRPGESEAQYDARLPRYESRGPAQFAIELKAGTIERLKLKPGDRIELDLERLASLAAESPKR